MSTIHNPTNFEPSDYSVRDYLDNKRPIFFGQDVQDWQREIEEWEHEMTAVLGADWRSKAYHCIHCGNGNVRWITVVEHHPTGELVVFGSDCTARLGFADKMAFKLAMLQSKAEAAHQRMKIWTARCAFLETRPELAEAVAKITDPVHERNTFAKDIVSKLNHYGSISERQAEYLLKSLARDVETAARKAAEAQEVKGDAPEGRVTVIGVVLSTKIVETQWGSSLKMMLKLENNSKVWLTAPSKAKADRGNVLTVTATFERSKDDSTFGFGKRPVLIAEVEKPVTEEVRNDADHIYQE